MSCENGECVVYEETIKRNISNYSLNTLESLLLSNYKNMAKLMEKI